MSLHAEPSSEAKQAYTRARKLFQSGHLREAEEVARTVVELSPGFASGRRLYADILMAGQKFSAARSQLQQALTLFPGMAPRRWPILLHIATSYVREGDIAGALGTLQSADFEDLELLDSATLSQLGYLFTMCESHEHALVVFETAVTKQPEEPLLLFNCAAANRAMGNLERAEILYDRVIALRPDDWEAYKNRSDLRKQKANRNHVGELSALVTRDRLPEQAAIQLNYALAKEYEDLEEYAASFAALEKGAKSRRKNIDYQLSRDLSVMTEIADVFDRNFLSGRAVPCEQGQEVIFVLGMPRTGSTLLDRILCASGEVASAGEPDTFARLLLQQAATDCERDETRNVILTAGNNLDIANVGSLYIRQMRARARQTGSQWIIDKNPMNFLYLGWIARALPAAKIVHLARNPMDTCYATYKTLFKSAYPFSYDQHELARYYCSYRKLMMHWREVFAERVIDVHYEDLVSDLPSASRAVYAACGVPWKDQVLEHYYSQVAGTSTASAAQVRQPVYQSSVHKWHHLRAQLKPIQQVLEDAGISVE
ncbi:tetratricopeptide repeat-containing sulfotransferase family protein [Microbulbifer elongatus]|uniref:tetratricopeptide repeat-containing sulfotransferase family protein n=1 Tax=Microbulbifer elongatus TaxID=86173 RepID=UPI001E3037C4|nr:sulfotransferase [Microbulbifer elongatus]